MDRKMKGAQGVVKGEEPVRQLLGEITRRLEERFGVPEGSGFRGDVLGGLIRTILSQNTNDRNSGRAYENLRNCFPDYASMHRASLGELSRCISVAGLHAQKSARIKALLEWAQERFGGYNLDEICDWPTEQVFRELSSLKGIGVKTVAVVLLFRCGRDVFPVDTHVHRILRRIGIVPEKATPERTFQLIDPLVPPGKSLSLHVNLLKLGRTICRARKPNCAECPLQDLCRESEKWLAVSGIRDARPGALDGAEALPGEKIR